MFEDRIIIGLYEPVTIINNGESKEILARIDTGATRSSIDMKLAGELKLGPIVGNKLVKSAHGNKVRAVVKVKINLSGKIIEDQFTIADRSHMTYRILIGQNVLKQGFLIDPLKLSDSIKGVKE